MNTLTSLPADQDKHTWPVEVLEFARNCKVDGYLNALLRAARDLFPHGTVRVTLHKDPELAGVRFIVYEVCTRSVHLPDYLEAKRNWTDSLHRIVPAPLRVVFAQLLTEVAE